MAHRKARGKAIPSTRGGFWFRMTHHSGWELAGSFGVIVCRRVSVVPGFCPRASTGGGGDPHFSKKSQHIFFLPQKFRGVVHDADPLASVILELPAHVFRWAKNLWRSCAEAHQLRRRTTRPTRPARANTAAEGSGMAAPMPVLELPKFCFHSS